MLEASDSTPAALAARLFAQRLQRPRLSRRKRSIRLRKIPRID